MLPSLTRAIPKTIRFGLLHRTRKAIENLKKKLKHGFKCEQFHTRDTRCALFFCSCVALTTRS